MMRRLLLLLCFLLPAAHGTDVYRHVDPDGRVTYSDTPAPGSAKIKLPEVMTYSPPPVPERPAPPPVEPTAYQKLAVVAPQPDETIWDNTGRVELVVALEPDLEVSRGHRIQALLDGKAYGDPRASTRAHFANLERGTHTVSAKVVDNRGRSLIAAEPVTFHLHRQSLFFPNRQPTPAPLPGATP